LETPSITQRGWAHTRDDFTYRLDVGVHTWLALFALRLNEISY
jgi:hypothetical protein